MERKTPARVRTALFVMLLGTLLAFASSAPVSTVVIEYPNGTRSGDLRNGPWIYTASEPGGIRGRVGNLVILADKAVLEAPKGLSMQSAEGQRTATFEGSVVVRRGRVEARGTRLVYRESTGKGTLFGPVTMEQRPERADEDAVILKADAITFNVNTDTSESRGNVHLTSGDQEGFADEVYYEEDRALAIFTSTSGNVRLIRHRDEGELRIEGGEARLLVREKALIVLGGVTLKDGGLVTRGDALYYDDKTGRAIVVGSPATSRDEAKGRSLSAGTLLHDVTKHRVRLYGKPFELPLDRFARQGD